MVKPQYNKKALRWTMRNNTLVTEGASNSHERGLPGTLWGVFTVIVLNYSAEIAG